MRKVAIICAIRQESRPILHRLCTSSPRYVNGVPFWNCTFSNISVLLAESGIGIRCASDAARNIFKLATPDLVISTGFCGAVKSGLKRGDIVMAERILSYTDALNYPAVTLDNAQLWHDATPQDINIRIGTFITTEYLVLKNRISELLDDQIVNPVLEMESHAVASVCNCRGIPFAAIRAVSDTSIQDPYHACSKVFDGEMKISMRKTLTAVMSSPTITRELLRLYADAEIAGKSLANAIEWSLKNIAHKSTLS